MSVDYSQPRNKYVGSQGMQNMNDVALAKQRSNEQISEPSIRDALDKLRAYESSAPAHAHAGHVPSEFETRVRDLLWQIGDMLIAENRAYSKSAVNPVRIFSRAHPLDQIMTRIDDKLACFRHAKVWPGDDNIDELICHLVDYKVAKAMSL